MKMKLHPDMIEATRLTREGRLAEATVLLQRMLGGASEAAAPEAAPKAAKFSRHVEADLIAITPAEGETSWLNRLAAKFNKLPAAAPDGGQTDNGSADVGARSGQFLNASFTDAAGTRAYKLYVPGSYDGKPLPLIVMLHGCTQSPDDFAAGTRMNTVCEERGCFVAYPAQPSSANGQKCWNWFKPGDQQRGLGEPTLIAGITRQIARDYAIDAKRIYVAGLSAGGAAAAIMAATYPDIFAAVGVHSGLACGAASDMTSAFSVMRDGHPQAASRLRQSPAFHGAGRQVPTIVFHGDKDATVHPRNGHHVIEQSRSNGLQGLRPVTEQGRVAGGHAYSRTKHYDASGRAVLEMWVIQGAGHAWSGGSSAGSFTDPRGPDASHEMVRFFLEHAHPASKPDEPRA